MPLLRSCAHIMSIANDFFAEVATECERRAAA
jgi:hypothetical protein